MRGISMRDPQETQAAHRRVFDNNMAACAVTLHLSLVCRWDRDRATKEREESQELS